MSNNFGGGLAIGMALGHSSGRSSGREEATEEFDNEETNSIARVLLANPSFAKSVRDTVDELNRLYGKPQTVVQESAITPATRTGLLWLFHKEATGAEANTIRTQARTVIAAHFNVKGRDIHNDYIHDIAGIVADDAESYDADYILGRGAEFVMKLSDADYAHMGRIGTMEAHINALDELAGSKSQARTEIAETDGLADVQKQNRVYKRMLTNTVTAYAGGMANSLTAYYNNTLAAAAGPVTANDNADGEDYEEGDAIPGAKRLGAPKPA